MAMTGIDHVRTSSLNYRSQGGDTDDALLSHFTDQQREQYQRIEAFRKYWQAFESPYKNQEVIFWWKDYLASEDFQDIRNHPQVVYILIKEMDHKFFYGLNEVKMLFWDAYGFQDGDEEEGQEELRELKQILAPAHERQQRDEQDRLRLLKYEKIIHILTAIAIAAVIFLCVLIPVNMHRRRESGRRYLAEYMTEQYPGATFSEPERIEKQNDGSLVYAMYSSAHPELQITATVEDTYVEGVRTFLITEDYSQLLLEYYAAQYGLEAGRVTYTEGTYANPQEEEYSLLFYSDIGQIDGFCDTVEKMFCEQEELQKIAAVAVCTDKVLFPEVLLQSGVEHFPFADYQIYDLRSMEASELAAKLKEAYMIYMFQYEPWNITSAQYREWLAAYEKICEGWVNDKGDWHEVYDTENGEYLGRLFIPTYEYVDRYYSSVPFPTRFITVGNAFYYLMDREADLHINNDGSGFTVEFFGNTTSFGAYPEEEFYKLRDCY